MAPRSRKPANSRGLSLGPGLLVRFQKNSQLVRCCAAVGLIGAATLVRLALTPVLGDSVPFLFQLLALLCCARYLGLIPGLAAWTTVLALAIGRAMIAAGQAPVSNRFWLRTVVAAGFCLFLVWLLSRQARLRGGLAS